MNNFRALGLFLMVLLVGSGMTYAAVNGLPIQAAQDVRWYSQTITPAQVATIVCAEQTFTVTGLTTKDAVFVSPAATGNATSMTQARVSAANTLALMYCNPTAGALTPGAGTYKIISVRTR